MAVTIKRKAPKALITEVVADTSKFQCLLAASEIPTEAEVKKILPCYASFKLDGVRSPITGGAAMSRKMLRIPNRFIQKWVKERAAYLDGLDGELIVGPPNLTTTFNTTTSGVMSEGGEPDFKLYVFEHWDLGDMWAEDRYAYLCSYLPGLPSEMTDRIVLLEQKLIKTIEELRAYYAYALSLGYEGLILKHLKKAYKFGRSSIKSGHALKWKEFIDYNCVILEVKQAKTNTNAKVKDELGKAKRSTAKAGKVPIDEVGGFRVRCVEPESVYFNMEFSCGTGSLTQKECKALWSVRDQLSASFIKVKSQKLGGKSLPRFPGFFGFRDPIDMGDLA